MVPYPRRWLSQCLLPCEPYVSYAQYIYIYIYVCVCVCVLCIPNINNNNTSLCQMKLVIASNKQGWFEKYLTVLPSVHDSSMLTHQLNGMLLLDYKFVSSIYYIKNIKICRTWEIQIWLDPEQFPRVFLFFLFCYFILSSPSQSSDWYLPMCLPVWISYYLYLNYYFSTF